MNKEQRNKKIKELIQVSNEKGYLTYTDINDILPEDVVSPNEIDGMLMLLRGMDIEILDATDSEKGRGRSSAKEKDERRSNKLLARLEILDDPVEREAVVEGTLDLAARGVGEFLFPLHEPEEVLHGLRDVLLEQLQVDVAHRGLDHDDRIGRVARRLIELHGALRALRRAREQAGDDDVFFHVRSSFAPGYLRARRGDRNRFY